jgi:hypothetical protein
LNPVPPSFHREKGVRGLSWKKSVAIISHHSLLLDHRVFIIKTMFSVLVGVRSRWPFLPLFTHHLSRFTLNPSQTPSQTLAPEGEGLFSPCLQVRGWGKGLISTFPHLHGQKCFALSLAFLLPFFIIIRYFNALG